jgi:hypothetical protein
MSMSRNARIALVAAVAVAAVVAFVLLQPGDDEQSSTTTAARTTTTAAGTTQTTTTRPAPPPIPVIRLRDGKPAGGVRNLDFKQGERVRFAVTSNVDDQVHVHGYDITRDVRAGGRVVFSFRATQEGVYEVESHDFETQIAELKVAP